MTRPVRVRFAPSPTGALHIGGVRTALYNYLFARQHQGQFILRIEDTDQGRFVPGAEAYIQEALAWCGIVPDESPDLGGPHAPYRQSERKAMYRQYAEQLVAAGHAYYAFDTPEALDEMRERLKRAKVATPQYNAITRLQMRNSLTLPEDEVRRLMDAGTPYVVRLKIPRKEEIRLHDLVRGWVLVHSNTLDDKVLLKGDGMPTYHLANVVDDHLMEITHVIRGEEWLPSAPTHVLLYRFLGWEDTMPQFAHLPLLLKPDGNGKLSKRDAERHGFPVFPLQWHDDPSGQTVAGFREAGYLPEAMRNFLAFLGWNPGTAQELFSEDELIAAFRVERIGKAGIKFDIDKAKWYNQQYLRQRSDADLATFLMEAARQHGTDVPMARAERVVALVKERATFPQDLWAEGQYLLAPPAHYDEAVAAKRWNDEALAVLHAFRDRLRGQAALTADEARTHLNAAADAAGIKLGKVLQAVRLAITGVGAGPDLMEIIAILGPEETVGRIDRAEQTLAVKQN